MVLLASNFDQSKYLNASDLTQEKALRIESVTAEMVRKDTTQEQRAVVWFTNHKKGLVLNKTNLRTCRAAFGDDMEKWAGKVIIVYPTQTDFGGKIVGALRVRIPPPKQAAAGNGQPAKPKNTQEVLERFAAPPEPEPEPEPEPKPSLKDDLDDELGF